MVQADKKKRKILDNRYEILSIVGRGRHSVVYRARHLSGRGDEVALKVLVEKKGVQTTGLTNAERLRKEALAMVSARHKYVIRLDDFHSIGDLCFLAMEYAPNLDLRSFAEEKGGRLSPVQAERFFRQSLEALVSLHDSGIIHRDIKPDNILVVNERQIRLADFGVALLPGESDSPDDLKKGVGTMEYMAPEILQGKKSSPESDLYSLGLTFYELLSGKSLQDERSLAEIIAMAEEDKHLPPIEEVVEKISLNLASTINKCVQPRKEKRCYSARQALHTLTEKASSAPKQKSVEDAKSKKSEESAETAKGASDRPVGATRLKRSKTLQFKETPASEETDLPKTNEPSKEASPSTGADNLQSNPDEEKPKKKRRRRRRKKKKRDEDTQAEALNSEEQSDAVDSSEPESTSSEDSQTEESIPQKKTTPPREKEEAKKDEPRRPQRRAEAVPMMGRRGQALKEERQATKPATETETARSSTKFTPETKSRAEEKELEDPSDLDDIDAILDELMAEINQEQPEAEATPEAKEPKEEEDVTNTIRLEPEKVAELVEKNLKKEAEEESSEVGVAETQVFDRHSMKNLLKENTSEADEFEKYRTHAKSEIRSKPPLALFIGFAIVLNILLWFFTGAGFIGHLSGMFASEPSVSRTVLPEQSETIPTDFVSLAPGAYAGELMNFIPGERTPFSIISQPNGELTVLIGVEGWKPSRGTSSENAPKTLRLTANGVIINFEASEESSEFSGTFKNSLTGETGTWKVSPQ